RAWEKRQYRDRHSIAPPGDARAYIYFIGPEEGDRVKIGFSKNPWARIKDFQTGTTEQLHVVATVSTTENSAVHIHKLFEELRISGEWYRREGELTQVIN